MNNSKHNADGNGNIMPETKTASIKNECENIIPQKVWTRICPDCGKDILYNYASNFYTARSKNTLCSHCCIKGERSSFYGGKMWTEARRKWWSKNCPTLFTSKNNPASDPTVRKKLSEIGKLRRSSPETRRKISIANRGKNNPMYGKPSAKGTSNGWANWYKGFHFRSMRELQYYIREIDGHNILCESNVGKRFRIPYKDYDGADRTYCPDFFVDNHWLIEIKPKRLWNTKEVVAKKEAAEEFCRKMGYEYKLVDVEPNSLLLKEKYLNGEIKFVDKYKHRFEKYIGVKRI